MDEKFLCVFTLYEHCFLHKIIFNKCYSSKLNKSIVKTSPYFTSDLTKSKQQLH